jgi:hypothetical protein
MRTIMAAALQQQYLQTELILWILLVNGLSGTDLAYFRNGYKYKYETT